MCDTGQDLLVRSLREPELPAWYDAVAAAFAEKGTPRSHFVDHVERDPQFMLEGIRVCTTRSEEEIVSTLRVFHRTVIANKREIKTAGIGEVGTLPTNRGIGLATRLLEDGVAWAQSQGFVLGSLHSSRPPVVAYYARRGWISVPLQASVFAFDNSAVAALSLLSLASLAAGLGQQDCELVAVAPETLTHQASVMQDLERLHASGIDVLQGCTVRSSAYWQRWVQGALSDTGYVAIVARQSGHALGYLLARRWPPHGTEATMQVKEVFVQALKERGETTTTSKPQFQRNQVLAALLAAAMAHGLDTPTQTCTRLLVPTPLLGDLNLADAWAAHGIDVPPPTLHVDNGQMYRIINPDHLQEIFPRGDAQDDKAWLERLLLANGTHTFLKLDAF